MVERQLLSNVVDPIKPVVSEAIDRVGVDLDVVIFEDAVAAVGPCTDQYGDRTGVHRDGFAGVFLIAEDQAFTLEVVGELVDPLLVSIAPFVGMEIDQRDESRLAEDRTFRGRRASFGWHSRLFGRVGFVVLETSHGLVEHVEVTGDLFEKPSVEVVVVGCAVAKLLPSLGGGFVVDDLERHAGRNGSIDLLPLPIRKRFLAIEHDQNGQAAETDADGGRNQADALTQSAHEWIGALADLAPNFGAA